MIRHTTTALAALLATLVLADPASAEIDLSVDATTTIDSAATLNFYATGGDSVTDFELVALIEDGGAELGGTATTPVVTGVDFSSGFLASGTATDLGSVPLSPYWTVDSVSPAQSATGLIGAFILDTSSLAVGDTFELRFYDDTSGSTFPTFFSNDGVASDMSSASYGVFTVTVVPEPASAILLAVPAVLIRRRKASTR